MSPSEILYHLDNLDLRDTASILRRARTQNHIVPNAHGQHNQGKQVIVLYLDANDVISEEAVREAQRLRMAGVHVNVVIMDNGPNLAMASQLASEPTNSHLWVVGDSNSADRMLQLLKANICRE